MDKPRKAKCQLCSQMVEVRTWPEDTRHRYGTHPDKSGKYICEGTYQLLVKLTAPLAVQAGEE